MLPHREWNRVDVVTISMLGPNNNEITQTNWTTEHLIYGEGTAGKLGSSSPSLNVWAAWHTIFRPKSPDFALVDGMDECVDYGFWYIVSLKENSANETSFMIRGYDIHDANQWDFDLVSGQHYNGINDWALYPPGRNYYMGIQTINIADLPYNDVNWIRAYDAAAVGNNEQDHFFRNGARIRGRVIK